MKPICFKCNPTLNRWKCEGRFLSGEKCDATAIGVGGAIGLRAIGWYFEKGGCIFCPLHRPDSITGVGDCVLADCSMCKAKQEAAHYQQMIEDDLIQPTVILEQSK